MESPSIATIVRRHADGESGVDDDPKVLVQPISRKSDTK